MCNNSIVMYALSQSRGKISLFKTLLRVKRINPLDLFALFLLDIYIHETVGNNNNVLVQNWCLKSAGVLDIALPQQWDTM